MVGVFPRVMMFLDFRECNGNHVGGMLLACCCTFCRSGLGGGNHKTVSRIALLLVTLCNIVLIKLKYFLVLFSYVEDLCLYGLELIICR
uniref:Uncharacterized protein n=1 Tax=Rhizophora mucronata TaxID=61149 RepID=A0A2P2IXA6_RHIMU